MRKECVANWELTIVVVVYQNKACFTVIEYPVGIDTFHDTALVHSSVKPRNQTLHYREAAKCINHFLPTLPCLD